MKLTDIFKNYCGVGLLIATATAVTMNSCSEDIDDSDLYTFTGEMMIDHFVNNPETYSSYLEILGMVHPSKQSPSTMHELLAARGQYTCFAPTNEAVALYLDSLLKIGEVESVNVSEIPDSVAEDIVFNSIIENKAYHSTEFTEGALGVTNMNDRYIEISTTSEEGVTVLHVNTNSRIQHKDVEVENGYIHGVDRVLSPSKATIADLIIATPNLSMFGKLLDLTGWYEKVAAYRDEAYEEWDNAGVTITSEYNTKFTGKYPEHRYYGFTIFVEPDSVLKANGIDEDNLVNSLMQWLKANAYYDESTSYGNDYEDENNALNQFVAYHIVPINMPYNKLVTYSNERGYSNLNFNTKRIWKTNVWDYYETIGKHRRSVKLTGIRTGTRLNRHSVYNTSTKGIYYIEKQDLLNDPNHIKGLAVSATNGNYANNAKNGYYYTIDGMHVWHRDIPMKVLNERMRYDVCSMLPEMITNNCRLLISGEDPVNGGNKFFKKDYFENIPMMTDQTEFLYLPNNNREGGGTWMNYQTDEFNINGVYDFTMKLPPVPFTDTYEIRYGLNINGNRGMAQVYFGENPNNLPAIGIPLDLRLSDVAVTGWVSDEGLGEDEIEENDKAMRNNGYMKAPKYFWTAENTPGRNYSGCLRRIIYTGQLEAGKTYYIRFKSVLESTKTEFVYDYLEFVPKSVYNGDVAEDKW